jgi:formimidoylglutamate deiminase
MAGLTQRLGMGEAADFWSWRRAMYAFAARLDPEEQRAIAAQLYVELLKGGYTTVVEFHYLHHGPDGRPYDERAIMALALHEAALETGIALTLLPAVYMQADLDGAPLEGAQRRFALDPEGWARLAAVIEARFADDRNRALGLALHSLRAVPGPAIRAAIAAAGEGNPGRPIHIHLAEQPREVGTCLERFGRRPLDHLCAAAEVDHRWCLVHGTHLTPEELAEAGARHAVIGLCPTTEADLGDGAFPLADHLAADGAFGIGSDSNLCTRAPEELRLLEHGQRLATLRRTVAATPAQPHCGELLWCRALAGGAKAAGRPVGRLAPGFRADLIVLDAEHPSLYGREDAFLLDSLLFAPGTPIRDVMVGGLWCVRDGQHPAERTIAHAYRRALAKLLA